MISFTVALILSASGGYTAQVDDSRSHGALGDSLLSLDEAIQLANGSLTLGQLSTAERAKITGSGPRVDCIEVDAAVVPTISFERAITPLTGAAGRVRLTGVLGGGAKPILDVGTHPAGLVIRTHEVEVSNFEIRGGVVAVEASTTSGSLMAPARLLGIDVSGQSQSGFLLTATGSEDSAVYIADGELTNLGVGFELVDNGTGGELVVEGERLTFDGVTLGVDMAVNSVGNTSNSRWWRTQFHNGDTFVRVRRSPTSTQRQLLRIVHGDFVCNRDLSDVEGVAAAETVFHHHAARFVAPAGFKVYYVYPRDARFDVHGSEMVFVGDTSIETNRLTRRVLLRNNLYQNGTLTIDNGGVPPDMLWNRFENYTINVVGGNRTPVRMVASEFYSSRVQGNSTVGSVTLDGCYLSQTTTAGSVQSINSVAAPWLGETSVDNAEPGLGETIVLASSVPVGFAMVWDIAAYQPRPNTTTQPFRFYGIEQTYTALSGIVPSGLQLLSLTVPNLPVLSGMEFYLQGLVFPAAGQGAVPPLTLPIGHILSIQ